MTTLRSGSATHVGQVRSNNQDSFLVLADANLYGVADGMGGHNGGEVASAMAVENLEAHAGEPTLENLKQAARIGNRAIFEKAGNDAELHGMGTTLCAVRVVPGPEGDEIAWINVGDSRVYLFRDGSLLQLSRDHSLVEDLLRDGQLTEDEAKVHPKRNIITRALGIDVDVDVDGSTVIPFNGDRFLLCSDGLFGEVTADQISSVLRRLSDPTEAAEELVRLANESGGRDNITVVIVEVVDDDGRSLMAAAALAAAEQSRLESRVAEQAAAGEAPDTEPVPDPYVPVFADRKSSLPDATDDFGGHGEDDDLYGDLEGVRSKRFTWRVLLFVVALVAVIGVVLGAIIWTGNSTYYVGYDGKNVAVFQGKPGGVLWIDPTLVRTTDITRSDLPEDARAAVADNPEFGSEAAATRFVVTLQAVVDDQAETTSTTTSTTSTTTTTKPRASTTTTAPASTTTAAP
ncbi:Stp1/IreP family PP2C-type Ser/Thr phosphatase [Aquihabitans daechungensis]|uniref:Stp1/IreP family PP2C-type Ser/Thr phosphatase n=1 Tax=Aquihabitans daechungensis TaxID=1052257 RepID=UPI003BA109DF